MRRMTSLIVWVGLFVGVAGTVCAFPQRDVMPVLVTILGGTGAELPPENSSSYRALQRALPELVRRYPAETGCILTGRVSQVISDTEVLVRGLDLSVSPSGDLVLRFDEPRAYVEGSTVRVLAGSVGRYTYTSVSGASRTIPLWEEITRQEAMQRSWIKLIDVLEGYGEFTFTETLQAVQCEVCFGDGEVHAHGGTGKAECAVCRGEGAYIPRRRVTVRW